MALESVRAAEAAGTLGRAFSFALRGDGIPRRKVTLLRTHPVRLLSFLGSEYYYPAKKHAVDRRAARELAQGGYDLFHGWSGECLETLRVARRLGIPSLVEIPTWHRHKGRKKGVAPTLSERKRAEARGVQALKNRLLVTRQHVLEEYDLADILLVLSEKAEETFLSAGVPKEKLFRHQRGVDVQRFTPAPEPPPVFRAIFVGALIKRKGVHHLLAAWRRLALKNAELVLAGSVHPEIEQALNDYGGPDVKVLGFVRSVEDVYRSGSVHIFPSLCEGSAKATYEAAACGLPQITTRESGDVVVHGENGLIVPADDPGALEAAIQRLFIDASLRARMGAAGRRRVEDHFTWEHFAQRQLEAYDAAMTLRARAPRA